jgi:putative ABC transport system substrate-binding protein
MNRRAFILGLVGAVTPSPLAASAEPPARRIDLLMTTTPVAASHIAAAFADGLRELGHVEGKDVVFEYRWAEGKPERFAEMAAELVRHKVDVIVASSQTPALAAKRATQTIPIVMVNATDPVEVGLVASLARPGGNVTGLAQQLTPNGLFGTITKQGVGAVLILGGTMRYANRGRVAEYALKDRLPMMCDTRENVEAGCLMSYGASLTDLFRRAASYVDRILKGGKPADLPVEQPTKFELVINLKTAKALGITIPQSVLVRADEIIQ